MNEFEKQYREVQEQLQFNDYALVIKRVIDFTLDTQSVHQYRQTTDFLDWYDIHKDNEEAVYNAISGLLSNLHSFLKEQDVKLRQPIFSATQLIKKYNGPFALGPVDLELHEGEITGLVGENGNGKTTLLRLLCGELKATSGSIKYNFPHSDLYNLRTQLVYIPQRTETWHGPMMENLVFTAVQYGYKPNEVHLITSLITARLGLRPYRNHSWKNLSSGYKMRFELARMLLRKPKVLLIDEPLANLDILAQQTILDDLRNIARSAFRPLGIILSSQQLYEVEKTSDEVIFLKNGTQKNLYNKSDNNSSTDIKPFIAEFESTWTQAQLNNVLVQNGLLSLQLNGGTYIATFANGMGINDFMKTILSYNIPVTYLRDISNSTRRFFVS